MGHQIRTSLLMLSYLNERDQVSPVRIFSSLVVFPLVLDLSETSFFCVVWESKNNVWYYLICTQISPASNIRSPWVSWLTFDCHIPHMLKWSINFLERAPTPSVSESPQYSLLGTAECGDIRAHHFEPSKLCGCYREDRRNGLDPMMHCLGWQPLSLCAAATPEISEATSPQSTAVAWGRMRDGEGHLSFSLVLHFGREPEKGCLAPSVKVWYWIFSKICCSILSKILSLSPGLNYSPKSQASNTLILQFSKYLWATMDRCTRHSLY